MSRKGLEIKVEKGKQLFCCKAGKLNDEILGAAIFNLLEEF